ncbi:MAG TPA: DUF445 domain-containing protein [Acidimicrobiales bacterium]|nr:DUF445 domain-containing protein [Acidimicrobiales bacterium]
MTATLAGAGTSSASAAERDAERASQLRTMKRRATALLVVVAAAFVAVTVLADGRGGWGYVQAALEGSMVGGLADWFAVTALFRHPLGVPIPHTAVIRERKDQFGETLGSFVQQNFLAPDVLADRVRGANVTERAAAWMCDGDHATQLARHASEVLVGLADVVRDEDVHRILDEELHRALERLPVAPLAGRALRMLTAQGRHQELLDAGLRAAERFLVDNHDDLRLRFGEQSPWWLPDAAQDRIFERLLDGFTSLLRSVNDDPTHSMRRQFDERVDALIGRLETSAEMRDRGTELTRELLENPELRRWSATVWTDVKVSLRQQAADPESTLRLRLADTARAAGERLHTDLALRARADELVERAVRFLADHFHDEISGLVSGTIARWDAEETSDKLELLLGRDLQFIRINGTVVGALAGVAIHGLAVALH